MNENYIAIVDEYVKTKLYDENTADPTHQPIGEIRDFAEVMAEKGLTTAEQVKENIKNGVISGGMIPKVTGCVDAIDAGVQKVHIIDGRVHHCILLEIFTDTGIGTMITN